MSIFSFIFNFLVMWLNFKEEGMLQFHYLRCVISLVNYYDRKFICVFMVCHVKFKGGSRKCM